MTDKLIGTITPRAPITGGIAPRGALVGTVTVAQGVRYPEYDGPTEYTPLRGTTQIAPTAGHVVTSDITINPIPSNYGLITWDGSKLTVS